MTERQTKRQARPASAPRPGRKQGAKSTRADELNLRVSGVELDPPLEEYVRRTLWFQAGAFIPWMKRVVVHFENRTCRAKVTLLGVNGVQLEARAADPRQAMDVVAAALEREIRARIYPEVIVPTPIEPERAPKRHPIPPPENGGLIGRREGRGKANLARALERPEKRRRDQPVDTSRPGISATDRRAGGASTARRNSKRRSPKATVALEDSAQSHPSRKSTRRGANRVRHGAKQQLRRVNEVHSPRQQAERSRVHR